jgi:MYXO-CTERM domain-containing protein
MHSRWLALVAMSGLWVGCGGPAAEALNKYKPASLASEADVKEWAGRSSAPVIYFSSNLPLALSGVVGSMNEQDPTCPVQKKHGDTTLITGGCTDKDGVEWIGSMEQKTEGAQKNVRITYDGFGYKRASTCQGKTRHSTLVFEGTSTATGSEYTKDIEIDVRMDSSRLDEGSCTTTSASAAWEYRGSIKGWGLDIKKGNQVWSGSGRIGYEPLGVVEVETKSEVVEPSRCASEALSGSTTITSGGHTALIEYDGETDCDKTSTVKWSFDGKAQGEMEGVSCSAARGPALSAWGVALLGALGLMRRRARR